MRVRQSSFRSGIVLARLLGCMPATANPDNPDTDGDGVADELNAAPNDAGTSDLASYLFTGERPGDQAGEVLVRGAEGELASFVIGVPQHDVGDKANAGAVYLVSASDLAQLDSVDGRSDRAIGLGQVTTGANSWKFVGERAADEAGFSVASSGDLDGDGETDLLVDRTTCPHVAARPTLSPAPTLPPPTQRTGWRTT